MNKPDKFKVFGNKVLVKADMEADEAENGIIIPESCLIHDWNAAVIQVGHKCSLVKVGDCVLYSKEYAIMPFSDQLEYRIVGESNLIASIDDGLILPLNGFVLCKPEDDVRIKKGIHIPDKKKQIVYKATVIRSSVDASAEYHAGDYVYFNTNLAIQCEENGNPLALVPMDNIELKQSRG